MTRPAFSSLLLLGLAASRVCASHAAATSDTTRLRAGGIHDKNNNGFQANGGDKEEREFKRQSVIRRLYGPENGEVRKHVRLVEEKSERSRTGFLGDPDHQVPYKNHPYQKTYDRRRHERERQRQRKLEDDPDDALEEGIIHMENDGTTKQNTGGKDLYQPMRIIFETQALDDTRNADNAAKIDFIKNQILPK